MSEPRRGRKPQPDGSHVRRLVLYVPPAVYAWLETARKEGESVTRAASRVLRELRGE